MRSARNLGQEKCFVFGFVLFFIVLFVVVFWLKREKKGMIFKSSDLYYP